MQRVTQRFTASHFKNIRARVSESTGVQFSKTAPRGSHLKTAIGFGVFLICLLIATPALAVEVPAGYQILYLLSPETAQFFKPVQKSAVDQGVEIKVVEAYVNKGTTKIMITVRDTAENRIDGSVDLYDSYSINTGFDSAAHCEQVDLNSETNTADFLITIDAMNPQDQITGQKITFSVTTLLCGKEEVLNKPIQIDWSTIPETAITESADPYEGTVLVPGDDQMEPESGFYISGIGYVDDKLHIQLFTLWRSVYDDHAFLYLLDAKGNRVDADMRYRGSGYSDNAESEGREDYIDYIFPVPQSDIANYSLFGDFYSARTRIDGNWSITFPITNDAQ